MTIAALASEVTTSDLKLLIGLLAFPNYCAPAEQLVGLSGASVAERDRRCQALADRGWIDYESISLRFGLTTAGRVLLTLDRSVLPVTPDEAYVLRACRDRSITPHQIPARVPAPMRQPLITQLAQQGLLRITKHRLGHVWLTPAGKAFLRHDCTPQGKTAVLSWDAMTHYLQFMRQPEAASAPPEP